MTTASFTDCTVVCGATVDVEIVSAWWPPPPPQPATAVAARTTPSTTAAAAPPPLVWLPVRGPIRRRTLASRGGPPAT